MKYILKILERGLAPFIALIIMTPFLSRNIVVPLNEWGVKGTMQIFIFCIIFGNFIQPQLDDIAHILKEIKGINGGSKNG